MQLSSLLLLLAALAFGAWRWREERNQAEIVEWLRQNDMPLRTAEPDEDFSDLDPLTAVLANARIVGLGEATHGTREHFQFKDRMLRFLVKRMRFRVLAFESPWPTGLPINDYVVNGIGDGQKALERGVFGIWHTREVLEMLHWMREHNQSSLPGDKVQFVGIDMQLTRQAAAAVRRYLSKVDLEYEQARSDDFDLLTTQEMEQIYLVRKGPAESARASRVSLELLARFAAKRDDYIARSSVEEFEIVQQHARILRQGAHVWELQDGGFDFEPLPEAADARDGYMAENLEWFLRRNPGTKVVVWAHNGHVAFAPQGGRTLGLRLKERYGDAYVSVGFVLGFGSFRALDRRQKSMPPFPWAEFHFQPPPSGSFNSMMGSVGRPVYLVDLRRATGHVRELLKRPYPLREGYGIVQGRDPLTALKRSPLASHDLLVYIDQTSAARPLKGDLPKAE